LRRNPVCERVWEVPPLNRSVIVAPGVRAASRRQFWKRPTEADNIDVWPAAETDLESDLIEASENQF
jgi:hypothetical protein